MREIKFRAWDKNNETMISWNEMRKDSDFVLSDLESDLFIFQQFTGLKDKNGKKIYCSDFVGISKEKYGEVYWNEAELAWWVEPIGEYPNEPLRGKGNAVEVLGNKFEGLA